jgi:hypothetical protein
VEGRHVDEEVGAVFRCDHDDVSTTIELHLRDVPDYIHTASSAAANAADQAVPASVLGVPATVQ